MNFYERMDSFSPRLVRLLARNAETGKVMSMSEVCLSAEMKRDTFADLSETDSWDTVTTSRLRSYTKACNMDFMDTERMRQVDDYLRHAPTFLYLRRHIDWDEHAVSLKAWASRYNGSFEPLSKLRDRMLAKYRPLILK